MNLSGLLCIPRGITALIGSGGKTTAMYTLAAELSLRGSVICTTTTRIFPPEHLPVYTGDDIDELLHLLLEHGCVCVGAEAEHGKLAASRIPLTTLTRLADFVLTEADGSKGLPLKAHLPHEPVIPANTKTTILLVGADGFGCAAKDSAHRVEHFCKLSELTPESPVTVAAVAAVIKAENLADKVFINKVESEAAWEDSRALSALLPIPVYAGALKKGEWKCLS